MMEEVQRITPLFGARSEPRPHLDGLTRAEENLARLGAALDRDSLEHPVGPEQVDDGNAETGVRHDAARHRIERFGEGETRVQALGDLVERAKRVDAGAGSVTERESFLALRAHDLLLSWFGTIMRSPPQFRRNSNVISLTIG